MAVFSNQGKKGGKYQLSIGGGFKPHTEVVEILSCERSTADAHGNVTVQMSHGKQSNVLEFSNPPPKALINALVRCRRSLLTSPTARCSQGILPYYQSQRLWPLRRTEEGSDYRQQLNELDWCQETVLSRARTNPCSHACHVHHVRFCLLALLSPSRLRRWTNLKCTCCSIMPLREPYGVPWIIPRRAFLRKEMIYIVIQVFFTFMRDMLISLRISTLINELILNLRA